MAFKRIAGLRELHFQLAVEPSKPASKEPFLGVLQPIRHLLVRPKCFRLGRASPVGSSTRGFNVPFQGALNQYVARTDKSRKPRFLCLTGVPEATVLSKMGASGDILVT